MKINIYYRNNALLVFGIILALLLIIPLNEACADNRFAESARKLISRQVPDKSVSQSLSLNDLDTKLRLLESEVEKHQQSAKSLQSMKSARSMGLVKELKAQIVNSRQAVLGQLDSMIDELKSQDKADMSAGVNVLKQQVQSRFDELDELLEQLENEKNSARKNELFENLSAKLKQYRTARDKPPKLKRRTTDTENSNQFEKFERNKITQTDVQEPVYAQYVKPQKMQYFAETKSLAMVSDAGECNYTSADLDPRYETGLTDEIKQLAAELDHSPIKIFEYVSNEIDFETYWGTVKGAHATLMSGGGNSTDQASLLIALLRASNIPARYVMLKTRFDDESGQMLSDWIGTQTPYAALKVVNAGVIPSYYAQPDEQSGEGAVYSFAHVVAEACVPYSAYRGSGGDNAGHRWVVLDPSFEKNRVTKGADLPKDIDITGYLDQRTHQKASEYILDKALTEVRQENPNISLADVGIHREKIKQSYEFLPSGLPYRVDKFLPWAGTESAEISKVPYDHMQTVRVKVGDLLNHSYFSYAKAMKTISVGFRSLEVGNNLVDRFDFSDGGEINGKYYDGFIYTCASLRGYGLLSPDVNAVIRIDGKESIVSSGVRPICGDNYNLDFNETVTVTRVEPVDIPNYSSRTDLSVEAQTSVDIRDSATITNYAGRVSDQLLELRKKQYLEAVGADPVKDLDSLLNIAGLHFLNRFAQELEPFYGAYDHVARNYGGIVTAKGYRKAEYIFDIPFAIAPSGMVIGVLGANSAAHDAQDDGTTDITRKGWGFIGSSNEHMLWQELAALDGISTVRGLQYANEEGIEIVTLDCQDETTEAARLGCLESDPGYLKLTSNSDSDYNYPESALEDIRGWVVEESAKVTLPRQMLNYQGWIGFVYSPEKPNGAAAWLIGQAHGGYCVMPDDSQQINYVSDLDAYYDISGFPEYDQIDDEFFNDIFNGEYNSAQGYGDTPGVTVTGGDPVNLFNGNMYHTETDISLKGVGIGLVFSRTYNSLSQIDGPMGFGWTHSYNHYLKFEDDNFNFERDDDDSDDVSSSFRWVDGDGSSKFISFTNKTEQNGIGFADFETPEGFDFKVTQKDNGAIVITETTGLVYTFAAPGNWDISTVVKLLSISDRFGNTLSLHYSANDELDYVEDSLGRRLEFSYEEGRIATVEDWDGHIHEYRYDGSGNLTEYYTPLATQGAMSPTLYNYYTEADGSKKEHKLKSFTYPNSNKTTFEYYADGRAFRHYNNLNESYTFEYNDFSRMTRTVNERGGVRQTYFDKRGKVVKEVDEKGEITRFEFDSEHAYKLTKLINPLGYETKYEYDSAGNLTRVTQPDQTYVEYSNYNQFGEAGKIRDANGNYTILKFDGEQRVTDTIILKSGYGESIDPQGYTPVPDQIVRWKKYTYESGGIVKSITTVRDFVTGEGPEIIYDWNDTRNNVFGLNVVKKTYKGDLNGDGVIDADEIYEVATEYDALGRVERDENENRYPVEYFYDDNGRLEKATDENGRVRSFTYDDSGNLVGQSLTSFKNGELVLLDHNSARYDEFDRVIATVTAAGAITYYQYDEAGNPVKVTDPDGYSTGIEYDELNRAVKSYDEAGHANEVQYDAMGRKVKTIDPNGEETSYIYYGPAGNGRLKELIDPMGRSTKFEYNASGKVTKVTDNAGNATTTSYNEVGLPIRIVSPVVELDGQDVRLVTLNVYDNLGNNIEVWSGNTNLNGDKTADNLTRQISYKYDDFGRKIKEIDALNRVTTFRYDEHNNLQSVTDAKQQTTSFTYYYGGLLETQTDHVGNTITYVRNELGEVTRVLGPVVNYSYEYDMAHRLERVVDERLDRDIKYRYTDAGRLLEMNVADESAQHYIYDAVGRIAGMEIITKSGDSSVRDTIQFTRDAAGRLTRKQYLQDKYLQDNQVSDYEYYADGRVKSIRHSAPTKLDYFEYRRVSSVSIDYLYDSQGQVEQTTYQYSGKYQDSPSHKNVIIHDYGYDNLGRLTNSSVSGDLSSGFSEAYGYDAFHNRKTVARQPDGVASAQVQYFKYDSANQLQEVRENSLNGLLLQSYQYDANGNQTVRRNSSGDVDLTMDYDEMNRVKCAGYLDGEMQQQCYRYDHRNRRVEFESGNENVKQYFQYAGNQLIAKKSLYYGHPVNRYYAYEPGTNSILLEKTTETFISELSTDYVWKDALGSVISDGRSYEANYDAWGKRVYEGEIGKEKASPHRYAYAGMEWMGGFQSWSDAGIYYAKARIYDANTGRFNRPDPLGMIDSINRYTYVMNSPTNFVDPMGLSAAAAITYPIALQYHQVVDYKSIHTFLRITPTNQEKWKNEFIFNKDDNGRYYTTIGGGPENPILSSIGFGGDLLYGFNFGFDPLSQSEIEKHVKYADHTTGLEVIIPPCLSEDEYIQLLIDMTSNFKSGIPYSIMPEGYYGAYGEGVNSNSFTSGILLYSGGNLSTEGQQIMQEFMDGKGGATGLFDVPGYATPVRAFPYFRCMTAEQSRVWNALFGRQ